MKIAEFNFENKPSTFGVDFVFIEKPIQKSFFLFAGSVLFRSKRITHTQILQCLKMVQHSFWQIWTGPFKTTIR